MTDETEPYPEDEPLARRGRPRRRHTATPEDRRSETMCASRPLAGKPRVITMVLWRDGEHWLGRLKSIDTPEQADEARVEVVRRLQMLAFGRLESAMRRADAPLIKEVVFKIEEA